MGNNSKGNSIESNNQIKKLIWLVLAVVLLITVVLGYGIYSNNQSINLINDKIDRIDSSVKESESTFESRVVESIAKKEKLDLQERLSSRMKKYASAEEAMPKNNKYYGDQKARFTLAVFTDLLCPYCKRFHQTPLDIADQSKGNINVQWVHFPLSFHEPSGTKYAMGAECVAEQKGNKAFWAYVDDIFTIGGEGIDLTKIAIELGADAEKFNECLSSRKYYQKVQKDIAMGVKLGVNSTPTTYIIDNSTGANTVVKGALPPEAIIEKVKAMIMQGSKK